MQKEVSSKVSNRKLETDRLGKPLRRQESQSSYPKPKVVSRFASANVGLMTGRSVKGVDMMTNKRECSRIAIIQ